MFYVQYGPEIPTSAVPSDMENAVRGVLNALMMDHTNDLNELVVNDRFFISSVSAGVVPPAKLGCKLVLACDYAYERTNSLIQIIPIFFRFLCPNSSQLMHSNFC